MSWVTSRARPDIVALEPYRHAAWEPGLARLHANELPWRTPGDDSQDGLNRYPEPQPRALIERLAALYRSPTETLLATRGSDEAIDLLTRAFCRAGEDAVVVCPPTFGMYAAAARIQGARVVGVPLLSERGFALDAHAVLRACGSDVKLVFLCSPNNPTGNLLAAEALIPRAPNLAILRTLSKAHGLAGARLGTLIAEPDIIALLRKVIAPYAITQQTVELVLRVLGSPHLAQVRRRVGEILAERERLRGAIARSPQTIRVLPSEANFFLVRLRDPALALGRAREAGLLVRDVRGLPGLADALRVTVGTPEQNERLLEAWE